MLPKVDLLDFYRGKLSARRLLVLIKNLPRESAFGRAADPRNAWGAQEHLTATVVDVLQAMATGGEAKPLVRPGQDEKSVRDRRRHAWRAQRAARKRASKGGAST